jgi:hypothetical protein
MRLPFLLLIAILLVLPRPSAQIVPNGGPWQREQSGTTAGLRGIHAVGAGIAWASGTDGVVLRTEDGGYEWQQCAIPPGAAKLDFRGVWAWDARNAIVMSSGPGDQSRVYRTGDGCITWTLAFANPDATGFFDDIQFLDKEHGFLLGDPVPLGPQSSQKVFALFKSEDGGAHWIRLAQQNSAGQNRGTALAAEHLSAFAASNTSLFVQEDTSWFGVGGPGGSYIVRGSKSAAQGQDSKMLGISLIPVPLASGTDSSGVFSLAFRDQSHGIAVGGDFQKPDQRPGTAAYSADGGRMWSLPQVPPHGYRSAVAWDAQTAAWIAVGTNGSDISYDDGRTWQKLDEGNWNALSLPWVVGPKGRIAKLVSWKLPHSGAGSR